MKNTIILPEIYLHALTAFEVGTNPEHINHGLIKSGLASWVKEHLTSLKGSDYLTISGHTLDLLDEEAPELLDELISVVDKENISLVGVPYYNTSLALLSPENLTLQWEKNQQSLQHYFGKKAQSIYLADQPVPAALSPALRQLSVSVLGDQSRHVESKSLGSTFVKDLDPHVGAHSPYQERPEATDLLAHVSSELVLLEP
ncbi:MAG: hypothetical protein KDK61_09090 [Simkania sp.]|nr:hypothetical protein [Simkania sp.]